MSHFTVLVIGEDVEKQLSPFDENIEMPEYRDGLVSKEDLESFKDVYTNFKESRGYGPKDEKEAVANFRMDFEELYKKYGNDWNGDCWKKIGGHWLKYSTYNPKSKWDWFSVGGRWAGMLKLKKGKDGMLQKPSCLGICKELDDEREEEYNDNLKNEVVDSAVKGDIDFSMDKEEYSKAKRFWEIFIEGDKPKNKREEKIIEFTFHKKEYYTERYKNKKTYAKSQSEFGTYAVLKDGEWFEKGEMGWFGCSSETSKESQDWDKGFYDKFIKDLPDDTLLTVVDCHI